MVFLAALRSLWSLSVGPSGICLNSLISVAVPVYWAVTWFIHNTNAASFLQRLKIRRLRPSPSPPCSQMRCSRSISRGYAVQCDIAHSAMNGFQHSALSVLKCGVQGRAGPEGGEGGWRCRWHLSISSAAGKQQGREGSREAEGERRQGFISFQKKGAAWIKQQGSRGETTQGKMRERVLLAGITLKGKAGRGWLCKERNMGGMQQ